jgi:histidyl-tRNA synthetase
MAGGALPGFRDFYPDEFAQRAHIFGAWREVARRFAFVEYDGPPLEPLDLYTKKSGDEIAGQLYNFIDKGDRQVALRPEMTPTFARMVAERANALRKPVRWFSIPQLFRYERAQRGRLREHFQLNVDIVGEASELADAELLCVAITIMKELGLDASDVRARVSDRQLLNAILTEIGVSQGAMPTVYSVLDKLGREQTDSAKSRLIGAGITEAQAATILAVRNTKTPGALRETYGKSATVAAHITRLETYFAHLDSLGVHEWVDLDLSIVRGLAYYTGIVFELFDAKGELRAICGGGRYDNLLNDLGGADLPALGFGMGDVVLANLIDETPAARARMDAWLARERPADLYVVIAKEDRRTDALALVQRLRDAGHRTEFPLAAAKVGKQFQTAEQLGATRAILVGDEWPQVKIKTLASREEILIPVEEVTMRLARA